MESKENFETKPVNNNNDKAPISSGQINVKINYNNLIDEKVETKNTEVIINNNIKNNNPTVEKIHVNISKQDQKLDISSIDNKITSKFLMKIYGILLFQFIIIFGFVLLFQIKSISGYIKTHPVFYWSVYFFTFTALMIVFFIFIANPDALNRVPTNYFILFIMTTFLGLLCGVVATLYKFEIVICAISCVIAISFGSFCIGIFIKTKDLKFWHLFIPSTVCLIIHYVIMVLIFRSNYLYFLYCSIIAIIYALYISIDTLEIKEKYSIDDYILGAIILTLDIIQLFLYILRYFGSSDCD
jgi:FtsH-binding integral membrane protein